MRPLFVLVFACLQTYVIAQEYVEPLRIEDAKLAADLRRTRDEILKNSPSTLNPWEGEYRGNFGDDSYDSIFVSVEQGFAMLEHGNSGIHAGNCGEIKVVNSEISIFLKYKERRRS